MSKKGFIGILIVGAIFIVAGVGTMLFAFRGNEIGHLYVNDAIVTFNATEVKGLYTIPSTGVRIDRTTNTIEFYGSKILINVIASPENGSMYSFGVYGLVNPTIKVRKDALVTIQLINADDDMYHGLVITEGAPPYPYMGTMMFDRPVFFNSYIQPLSYERNGEYRGASAVFIASVSGTFYYICQVIGHASKGMYGKFIVKD